MNTASLAILLSLALAATVGQAHAQTSPAADQAAAPAAAATETANTWLATISGTAANEGILTLTVTPWDIEPIAVSVRAKKGESADMIALKFRDGFRASLDQNTFRVDLQGKDAIRILAKHGDHRFGLATTENRASGVDVDLAKEK